MVSSHPRKAKTRAWWIRHNKDLYVKEARKSGYRSRASFKLLEIQEKFKLVENGHTLIDLGCAPGGWSVLLADMVGEEGLVVGVDRIEMQQIAGVAQLVMDITDEALESHMAELLGAHHSANGIFSDIAPNTTGHRKVDRLRMEQSIEDIWDIIKRFLSPDGYFVMKIRDGAVIHHLQQEMKQHTRNLRVFKPDASRNSSSENYLIGTGFQAVL